MRELFALSMDFKNVFFVLQLISSVHVLFLDDGKVIALFMGFEVVVFAPLNVLHLPLVLFCFWLTYQTFKGGFLNSLTMGPEVLLLILTSSMIIYNSL